jgi:uncharacterized protein (TIGR00251 family)
MKDFDPIQDSANGVSVRVRVIPRAQRSEIVGIKDGTVVVRLNAPPVDGKANEALLMLMVRELGLRKSQVQLTSGEKSRNKVLSIAGLARSDVARLLDRKE